MPQDVIPRPETPSTIRISFLKVADLGVEFFDSVKKTASATPPPRNGGVVVNGTGFADVRSRGEIVATRVWKGSACDVPIGGETQATARLIRKPTFI
jgi:hypothetical protein